MIRRAFTILAVMSLPLFIVSLGAAIWASVGDDAHFVARHGTFWQFRRDNGALAISTLSWSRDEPWAYQNPGLTGYEVPTFHVQELGVVAIIHGIGRITLGLHDDPWGEPVPQSFSPFRMIAIRFWPCAGVFSILPATLATRRLWQRQTRQQRGFEIQRGELGDSVEGL